MACRKARYPTALAAERTLVRLLREGGPADLWMRAYYCRRHCRAWHLGHLPADRIWKLFDQITHQRMTP